MASIAKILTFGLADFDVPSGPKPPKVPEASDADIKEKARKKRRLLAGRQGFRQTVLTNPGGINESDQTVRRATALGRTE